MPLINAVIDYPDGDRRITRVTWAGITNADTCSPVSLPQWPDRTVQVFGTFGGANISIQGSNDGTNFAAVNDTGGTAIAIAAAGFKVCNEVPYQIKPAIAGGAGSTLSVVVVMRTPSTIVTKS